MRSGIELIAEERKRQIEVEGWTKEHDAIHEDESMSYSAACYAIPQNGRNIYAGQGGISNIIRVLWPWEIKWWKPTPNDRIRELQKAGALIAAEIDRIQSKQKTIKAFELEDKTDNICNYCNTSFPDCFARLRFGNHHTGDNIIGCDSYNGNREDVYINEKEYTEDQFNNLYV